MHDSMNLFCQFSHESSISPVINWWMASLEEVLVLNFPIGKSSRVIYHNLIVHPLLSSRKAQGQGGASIVRCSSHQEELFEVDEKLQCLQAGSGFEQFRLCHSHYVMGIRSCELSEPHNVYNLPTYLFHYTIMEKMSVQNIVYWTVLFNHPHLLFAVLMFLLLIKYYEARACMPTTWLTY